MITTPIISGAMNPPTPAKPGYDGRMEFPENQGGKKGLYLDDLFTTAALNFVRINKPDRFNDYRPFFLYLVLHHSAREQRRRPAHG